MINTLKLMRERIEMIVLDYRDKRPIYEQVYEKIERLIVGGALDSDSKMPSVRSLAMELMVNPNTIQRAYAMLEQSGYLYTISGRGNFVAPEGEWRNSKIQSILSECKGAIAKAKEAGVTKKQIMEQVAAVFEENEV